MRIGFIGLGNMGLAMAGNLVRADHALTVYNRTPGRAAGLPAPGARVADTPRDLAADAEVIVTMLADDEALMATMYGIDGALAALRPGAIHLSMSTVSPGLAERLAAEHETRGATYVAAPVFGRPDAAQAAKLWIVAAGPAAAIERCIPVLDVLGQGTIVVGTSPAQANVVKVAGNFILASAIVSMGEAFALVRKYGIEPGRFLEIINEKVVRSPVYQNYGSLIATEHFEPAGFKLRHGLKDLRLALQAGDEAAVPLPLASLLHDQFVSAMARGWADIDWSGVARVSAVDAGLEVGDRARA
jgi:3-hydroxyisobutyrate dehydrogenase-like beta-hydroxyacid dehydrogenase